MRVVASDARAAVPPRPPCLSIPPVAAGALRAEVQRPRRAELRARPSAGQVLPALQGLRSVIDDRLRGDLGGRYDRHSAQSVGTDMLTVTFILRARTYADAIRSAGLAAATLAEL